MAALVVIAVAALAAVNLATSQAVRRNTQYQTGQKRLQYLLIWLVPLLGAAAAWAVLREDSWSVRRPGDISGDHPSSPWNDMSGGPDGH